MIVLDANILIRAVLGRRVSEILSKYSTEGIRFFAPDAAFADAEKYLPEVLKKRGKIDSDLRGVLDLISQFVEQVDSELYLPFEVEARLRLRARDESDWPVLASALALSCPIWTEDADFFGIGVPVWTTSRIEIFLDSELNRYRSSSE